MKAKSTNSTNNTDSKNKDSVATTVADKKKQVEITMESLLSKIKIQVPKVGDLVTGEVIDIGKNSIYLDLDILGTGVVMGRELKDGLGIADNLKIGDKVEATVMEIENDDGFMELSLREAGYEKTWDELERKMKEGEIVTTKILAANRGGLMVEINGVTGFLPVSQLSNENYPRVEDGDKSKILQLLNRFVEQNIQVKVIDVDKEEEKLIVSEKATLSEKEEKEIKRFKMGDVIEGVVSGIVDFGAFIKFAPKGKSTTDVESKELLEGLVHISELAWQLIENPRDIVKVGEKVKCKIIGVDDNRVSLSIRALKKDPWANVFEKYKVGDIVEGTITKFNPFGAFVQLDEDIHGLTHVSELNRFAKGKRIEESFTAGKIYKFKVLSIEPRNHRMGLTPFIKEEKKTTSAGATAEAAPEKTKETKKTIKKVEKETKKVTKKATEDKNQAKKKSGNVKNDKKKVIPKKTKTASKTSKKGK